MPNTDEKRFSILLRGEALEILKYLGYLDGRYKHAGKNISSFFSRLICDYVETYQTRDRNLMRLELLKKKLYDAQRQRDKIENEIQKYAAEIQKEKAE